MAVLRVLFELETLRLAVQDPPVSKAVPGSVLDRALEESVAKAYRKMIANHSELYIGKVDVPFDGSTGTPPSGKAGTKEPPPPGQR